MSCIYHYENSFSYFDDTINRTTDGQYNTELAGNRDGLFGVDPDSGFLYAMKPFDRERQDSYTLQVSLKSNGVEAVHDPITINIRVKDENDNMPIMTENIFYGVVSKGTKQGVAFMHIKATDLDDPSTPNADLRYKIMLSNPAESYENMFQIDARTGAVSLTEMGVSLLPQLEINQFKLGVQVKDMGDIPLGYTAAANLKIDSAENTWVTPSPVFLQENLKGDYPRIISSVKWNGTEVHYSLEGNFKDGLYSIDDTGNIYVTEELDRERQAEYQIEVFAENDDGVAYSEPIQIIITVIDENDNRPIFSQETYHVKITETTAKGSHLLTLKSMDADDKNTKNAQISYKINSQKPKLPKDSLFYVEEETGELSLLDSSLQSSIANQYRLEVTATDLAGEEGGLSSSCVIIIDVIDVNDNPPVFLKNQFKPFTILEDTEPGRLITTLTATDEDKQLDNKIIDFFIQYGNEDETFGTMADQDKGTLDIFLKKELDFEQMQEYTLIVHAKNRTPLSGVEYSPSSTATVHIKVGNVNEAPVLTQKKYEVRVPESAQTGSVILTVEATDPDIYEPATLSYSLRNDTKKWLHIQEYSGKIQLLHSLDREESDDTYIVQVVVQEKGDPTLSATADVVIHILDVNDNFPFLVGDYSEEYFCTPRREYQRILIKAFDFDSVENSAPFSFSLAKDPTLQTQWKMTALNGTHAYLSMGFHYLQPKLHYVMIIITDSGTPPQSQHVHLPVTVCRCSTRGHCMRDVDRMEGMPTVASAVGILVGTLGAICLILIVIFTRLSITSPRKKTGKSDTTPLKSTI
ncbi:cadherin-16 [Bombina bombina]|uniref:cadherin-16 n=1 Tax=Bombina bombina TaxID=8345 RepID=UPI00235B0C95|nr:cadherin-16 [Bombina bombina]